MEGNNFNSLMIEGGKYSLQQISIVNIVMKNAKQSILQRHPDAIGKAVQEIHSCDLRILDHLSHHPVTFSSTVTHQW